MEDDFENNMDQEDMSALEDTPEGEEDIPAGTIATFVQSQFSTAQTARETEEDRWLQAYRNYRGVYGPNVAFTEAEKSKVFIKVTKTKVTAAYGQITDVLLGGSRFPLSINATLLPEGVEDTVHMETNPDLAAAKEEAIEMPTLEKGETTDDFIRRLGGLTKELEPVSDKLQKGPGTSPTQVTFHPAEISAKKMEKKIHDQLEESKAKKHLRAAAFECALFGTGIMKGPFTENKEYPKWDAEGVYTPVLKTVPKVSNVSIWNFYPDPDAANMEEAEWTVERHKMSRPQLRALGKRPYFRAEEIKLAVSRGENYAKEDWEQAMDDDQQDTRTERFEVLEFWGNVDRELLEDHDVEIPGDTDEVSETVNVNIWVCHGRVLRLVVNPFTPAIIPYYAVPYELNPYSLFGVGIAENMDDTQLLMNGFMRMAVDNAALSGNLLLEVDENALTPGQDLKVYPGKVFRRNGGAPGQGVFGTKFPNVSNENMQMFDKARQLSDESTGFPSFAHGQTGVSGVGRTASGISMLMSAANGGIRTVVQNFDDYLLGPLGKALFSFNMQFDYDPEIQGDLEVKAAGTDSLMANEVRSQRLMQLLGMVQNPVLAPFAKLDYIIREIAKSLDLDPDKVTNSMQRAAIQAEMLKTFQAANPPEAPQAPPGAPQGAPGSEAAGGVQGAIGTGGVPAPGTPGFSGNTGEGEAV
tara:strand:- start:138 stop:2222 length:2085 start_codon:yes stop_codon:yes gene_type:complete